MLLAWEASFAPEPFGRLLNSASCIGLCRAAGPVGRMG